MRDQAQAQREMMRAQRDMYRAQMRGLRRGSVVGPLLVIGIGVIFLLVQTGRWPADLLWNWYGRWWPFLLIGIGLIRLAEWGFDRMAPRDLPVSGPRPRSMMGAGVVFLLVLLTGSGLLLSAVHNHVEDLFGHGWNINQENIDEFLGDKHESDQTVTHACPGSCSVSIDNPHGDISVAGTSDDGQVHVVAHKEVFTRTDSEANTKAQQFSPRLDASGSNVAVVMPTLEGARADLNVTLPATAAVSITANRGDVRIHSLRSAVSVTANHGDVEMSAVTGPMSAHINHGDSSFAAHSVTGALAIEGRGKDLTLSDMSGPVSMSGEFFGTTHLEHIRGPIRFHTSRTDFQVGRLDGEVEISPNADLSADQLVGPVTLNTRNRNITLERVTGDLAVTNRNGSVDVTAAPPTGNIMIENRNGTVNVTMPNEAGFVVQAETTNGDLENDFSLPKAGSENHPSLAGTVNRGGPLVRISTTQGDVSLKKGSVAPLPPSPPVPPKLTSSPTSYGREQFGQGIQSSKEAAELVRATQEQVRSANREAANIQQEAQRRRAEAQKELQRAAQQAKQADQQ